MTFTTYSILMLFQVLIFSKEAELLAPTLTRLSPNLSVVEGESVTLEWTYDLNGEAYYQTQYTTAGLLFIVQKTQTNAPVILNSYTGRIEANITETYASITFLSVNRTDSKTYLFGVANLKGEQSKRNVEIIVQYPPSITDISGNQTVTVGDVVTLICTVDGRLTPNITWTRLSDDKVVNSTIHITGKQDDGVYRCTADNGIGNPVSRDASITVQNPPNITNISENRTVNQSEPVNLTCTADGNPLPSITWTRVSDNSDVTFPLTITGKKDEGVYRCTANNGVGDPDTAEVFITVQNYGPFGTRLTTNLSNNTAVLNKSFNLNCSAQANPTAKYRFCKEQESLFNTSTSSYFAVTTALVSDRKNEEKFSCTPFNEYGDGSSTTITVTVHYAPSVFPKNTYLPRIKGDTGRYSCVVDGSPPPNVTWYEGNDITGSVLPDLSGNELVIENLQSNKSYTCLARNYLGTDTGSVHFAVGEKKTHETVTIIKITLTITNKDCNSEKVKEDVEKFRLLLESLYKRDGIKAVKVIDTSCGSIILDVELHFTKSVSESEVITTLKDAAKQNRFGEFKVDPDSIKPTKKESPCKDSLFKDAECDLKVIILVIFVVCGMLLIACVVGGATYYWVHKRKQCRKDPRIHSSDDQEALHGNQSGADENAYSQANGSYADSGPPSANGTDAAEQQPRAGANRTDAIVQQQQVQGATPTKFTKKQKREEEKRKKEEEKKMKEEEKRMKEEEKKNKIDAEQNIPQYAVVDKSQKKKKKEVVEDACAQVYTSKKSKKKAKPGEMLYADLGEFKPREMPAVSVSPDPLPPIKRPPAYEETQYADITQYLKGNATLPDTNNSQGTEMTFANVDGGKEKPKDTANEGGNEEKPKETRM